MARYDRQGAIMRLVQEHKLGTQSEVAEALRREGFDVVQTTVSRDIARLGLVKVRDEQGRLVYALPRAADLSRLDELTAAIRRWVLRITPSGSRSHSLTSATWLRISLIGQPPRPAASAAI